MVSTVARSLAKREDTASRLVVAATGLIVLAIVFIYAVTFHFLDASTANSIFGISLLLVLGIGFGITKMRELAHQKEAWSATAADLGLNCRVVGGLTDRRAAIEGVFRGRYVQLSVSRDTQGRVPITCIDMDLAQNADAKFRIWGPFSAEQMAVMKLLPHTKRYGTDKCFLAFADPENLRARLFPRSVWDKLQRIDHRINISLVGQTLSFEQPGITYNSNELAEYVELLSEIAYEVSVWEVSRRKSPAPVPAPQLSTQSAPA